MNLLFPPMSVLSSALHWSPWMHTVPSHTCLGSPLASSFLSPFAGWGSVSHCISTLVKNISQHPCPLRVDQWNLYFLSNFIIIWKNHISLCISGICLFVFYIFGARVEYLPFGKTCCYYRHQCLKPAGDCKIIWWQCMDRPPAPSL